MRIDIITIFPNFFEGPFSHSILKRAIENNLVEIHIHDLRPYSSNKQKSVDDYQFGGGSGMVMNIQPIDNCISKLKSEREHVTPYIKRAYGEHYYSHYKDLFLGNYRATIDTFDDYIKIGKVFDSVKEPINISWKDLSKKLKDFDSQVITLNPIKKLVVGSVQFGLDYGINNVTGQPAANQVKEILIQAAANGVKYIDTARDYGNSEQVLGKTLNSDLKHKFKIITKLSPLSNCSENESKEVIKKCVKESMFGSCVRLNTNILYCLMLHRAEHLYKWDAIVWKLLIDLRNKNYIQRLGVSVQTPEELDFRKDIVKDVKYFVDLGKEIGKPVDFNWTLEMPDLD